MRTASNLEDSARLMLRKLYNCLTPQGRKTAPLVLICFLVMSITEVTGVASVLPFMLLVARPELTLTHPYLHPLYQAAGFEQPRNFVIVAGLLCLVTLALGNLFSAMTTRFSLGFAAKEHATLSRLLLRRYLGRHYIWFLSQNTNVLGRNVLAEVGSVPFGIILPLFRLLSRAMVVCLILAGLIWLNPIIATTTAIVLGSAYYSVWRYTKTRLKDLGKQRLEAEHNRYKVAMEALDGIKTTMVLCREAKFLENYGHCVETTGQIQTDQSFLNEWPRFLLETLAFGGVISLLIALVVTGQDATNTLPIISVFTLGAYRLMPALQQGFSYLASIRGNIPLLDYLYDDLSNQAETDRSLEDSSDRLPFENKIEMKEITFTYPGKVRPVVESLSLEIEKNSSIALVGSTGSGKTTLVDILLGLLQPSQGTIVVDGQTVTPESLRSWQRNIGYVSQDIYLSDDTLEANISLGIPADSVDKAAVIRAATLANLHEFIAKDLPDGYQTLVGERGFRLSGGQRQRIGIARALYHNPEVLVLDEATSSLDGITESAVMEAVQNLASRMTIIMIAHRLSTIQTCDVIYLLREGKIVDRGSYPDLLARNKEFQAMAKYSDASSRSDTLAPEFENQ
jgi:ABC-type bacteriocin/lantibiotic exporter with double-glycine peptidase domain